MKYFFDTPSLIPKNIFFQNSPKLSESFSLKVGSDEKKSGENIIDFPTFFRKGEMLTMLKKTWRKKETVHDFDPSLRRDRDLDPPPQEPLSEAYSSSDNLHS